jgi:hypothetical protein
MSWSDEDSSWLSDFEDVSNDGFDDESDVEDFDDVSNDGVVDEAPHDFPDDVFSNDEASTVEVEDYDDESPPNDFPALAKMMIIQLMRLTTMPTTGILLLIMLRIVLMLILLMMLHQLQLMNTKVAILFLQHTHSQQ